MTSGLTKIGAVPEPSLETLPHAQPAETRLDKPIPKDVRFTWWLRCQNRHVAAMGKGKIPLGQNIYTVEFWQPPWKVERPHPSYKGPPLCTQCGSQLPLLGEQINSRLLVKGPPPSDYGTGDPPVAREPEEE